MHKILWDFTIQTNHLIPARRLDLLIINKKKKVEEKKRTSRIVNFTLQADYIVKIEESDKKVLRPWKRTKKTVEYESDSYTNCNWRTWNGLQKLDKSGGRVGNRRENRDYPDYRIVEIGQNFAKVPGDLK